ncbi:MAG: NfeD family protein [Bacillota bacterium]|nr:NfeD family protein [Bacillota bacterium]
MDFLAENLAIIICIVFGVGLLVIEMFMPGFGIPGISGIALLLAGVYFNWTKYGALAGLGVAVAELVIGGAAIALSLRSASKGKLSKSPLVLKGGQSQDEGFSASEDFGAYLGQTGITQTVLRPAGIAEFGDARLNVVSAGEFIGKGAAVVVKEVEGARILVEEVKNNV